MNKGKLKVWVIPGWFPGLLDEHAGDFVLKQAQDLANFGNMDVTVIYPELSYQFWNRPKYWCPQTTLSEHNNVVVYRHSGFSLPRFSFGLFVRWRSQVGALISSIMDEVGAPDIIHAHTFVGGFAASAIKSSNPHIPVILTEHSHLLFNLPRRYQKIIKLAYVNADHLLAPSEKLLHFMNSWRGNSAISRIPLSIDEQVFQRGANARKKGPLQLITVCELLPIKNLELQIEVLAVLNHSGFPAELTIVGDGPKHRDLLHHAKHLGVFSSVHFMGWQESLEVANLLRLANIYLCTSLQETFGLSILEALSCGIPVVSTRCGGPEDLIHDRNGMLVEATKEAFSSAIRSVAAKNMAVATNPLVDSNIYGSEAVVKKLHSLYYNYLQGNN